MAALKKNVVRSRQLPKYDMIVQKTLTACQTTPKIILIDMLSFAHYLCYQSKEEQGECGSIRYLFLII